eukprot:gnl/TRDRNA2_/TRDRNA2_131065_c0_seq3.p2 gnl/TRDRNA2_/TRDRNA2_131065_c0~~gnl/TRDRNA2_/TRDRNA2_131065_c0_seq3.p2  ORF type:complete len:151 (-),score=36.22 gnl/TRDRNA2_/TRDRNA2_131065_c0_seq3:82-534(-)
MLNIKGETKPIDTGKMNRCNVNTFEHCTKRETEYVQKYAKSNKTYIEAELIRITGMAGQEADLDETLWLGMRIRLLEKMRDELGWCDVNTLDSCSDKEIQYLGKQRDKGKEKVQAEIKRLAQMQSASMNESQRSWLTVRTNLLNALKDEL